MCEIGFTKYQSFEQVRTILYYVVQSCLSRVNWSKVCIILVKPDKNYASCKLVYEYFIINNDSKIFSKQVTFFMVA